MSRLQTCLGCHHQRLRPGRLVSGSTQAAMVDSQHEQASICESQGRRSREARGFLLNGNTEGAAYNGFRRQKESRRQQGEDSLPTCLDGQLRPALKLETMSLHTSNARLPSAGPRHRNWVDPAAFTRAPVTANVDIAVTIRSCGMVLR